MWHTPWILTLDSETTGQPSNLTVQLLVWFLRADLFPILATHHIPSPLAQHAPILYESLHEESAGLFRNKVRVFLVLPLGGLDALVVIGRDIM